MIQYSEGYFLSLTPGDLVVIPAEEEVKNYHFINASSIIPGHYIVISLTESPFHSMRIILDRPCRNCGDKNRNFITLHISRDEPNRVVG